MKLDNLKTIGVAAIALVCMAAPLTANAQRYNHGDYHFDRRDLRNSVDAVERESNSFRFYFEHNFRSNGHKQTYYDGSGNPVHEGAHGQMTLKDAIQNVDEDFERLRAEVNAHGRSRHARDLMAEITDRMGAVDVRVNHVADFYRYSGRDRHWAYDRSELQNRWTDLRADINDLSAEFNGGR